MIKKNILENQTTDFNEQIHVPYHSDPNMTACTGVVVSTRDFFPNQIVQMFTENPQLNKYCINCLQYAFDTAKHDITKLLTFKLSFNDLEIELTSEDIQNILISQKSWFRQENTELETKGFYGKSIFEPLEDFFR